MSFKGGAECEEDREKQGAEKTGCGKIKRATARCGVHMRNLKERFIRGARCVHCAMKMRKNDEKYVCVRACVRTYVRVCVHARTRASVVHNTNLPSVTF